MFGSVLMVMAASSRLVCELYIGGVKFTGGLNGGNI